MKRAKASLHALSKDTWLVKGLSLEHDTGAELVIVMNRDPEPHLPQAFVAAQASMPTATLMVRSRDEIIRALQQALERYDDLVTAKQLSWPKDIAMQVLEDNHGQILGRLDCLGKKGVHSRERLLDVYSDHAIIYRRFIHNKTLSLIEKADIIFTALGIALPLQQLSHPYPKALYYRPQNTQNHALITVIQKRFNALKALYG